MWRKVVKWLQVAAIVYIACGAILYFLQDKFLFHPEKLPLEHVYKFDAQFREINLPVTDEKNLSIIQFTTPDSICKGVVLYFHGNRRNIARYAQFAPGFTRNNYEVWMIDYPGFGKSTGKRDEQQMYADAALLYKMAKARFSEDSIVIYGKSLGTGVASQLASVRKCKKLLLETPYYSIEKLFNHYAFMYPVSLITKYHFPVSDYLTQVDEPVSIFHGTNDGVIPYKQSKELIQRANNRSELITIEGGRHNNLAEFELYQQKLDSLLK